MTNDPLGPAACVKGDGLKIERQWKREVRLRMIGLGGGEDGWCVGAFCRSSGSRVDTRQPVSICICECATWGGGDAAVAGRGKQKW